MKRHTCWPSFFDMEQTRSKCAECGGSLVRILHGPGHMIDGKSCGFPDMWRYCWITAELAATESADLLTLPRWKVV